jgi:hypothetical protein
MSAEPTKPIIEGHEYKEEEKTMVSVMDKLNQAGYTEQFRVSKGRLERLSDQKSWGANEVRIMDFYRFEGVTDPDDMSILYALECKDGTKGTISNSYGTYADTEVDEFMKCVEDTGKNLERHA